MDTRITALQRTILNWYTDHGRQLPWRQTTDPYQIMVAEIMLQQTQADRVLPKYLDWLKHWPTATDLATAPTSDVIKAWAGLGYNRRSLYLQRAAQALASGSAKITADSTPEDLIKLPGIGPYTAAAILVFSFNTDQVVVDTNIKRFYQLIHFGDQVEPKPKELQALAALYQPKGRSRDWYNALMDIGAVLSKYRGSQAQQQALIDLFPILKQFDLPPVSDQVLKRPKQSQFINSKRYWRGRILDIVRQHNAISLAKLHNRLNDLPRSFPYQLTELVGDLQKEGLLVQQENRVTLP